MPTGRIRPRWVRATLHVGRMRSGARLRKAKHWAVRTPVGGCRGPSIRLMLRVARILRRKVLVTAGASPRMLRVWVVQRLDGRTMLLGMAGAGSV